MRILFVAICITLLTNCSTSQKNFAGDRGNDFGDIASLSYGVGFGFQISVSSISTGIGINATAFGFKHSDFFGTLTFENKCVSDASGTFLFGYKNNEGLHREEFGVCDHYIDSYFLRNKAYKIRDPFKKNLYGRVKIRAGIIIGATVEFNFYELYDFIVGFWGYDPLDDDWNIYYEKIIQAENAKRNTNAQPIKSK